MILGKYRWYALSVDVCLIPDQRLLKLLVCVKDCCVGSYRSNLFCLLVIATERAICVNFDRLAILFD